MPTMLQKEFEYYKYEIWDIIEKNMIHIIKAIHIHIITCFLFIMIHIIKVTVINISNMKRNYIK